MTIAISREDAIYDAALALLKTGRRFHRCPACDVLVHDVDSYTHAKVCAALRDMAVESLDNDREA